MSERHKTHRKKILEAGGSQECLLLQPEPAEALRVIVKRTGRTKINIIESLLIEEAAEKRLDHRP